jgi:hypothetical protein
MMTYEELAEEYTFLYRQSWGVDPKNVLDLSYNSLVEEVRSMYAFINDLSKGALK